MDKKSYSVRNWKHYNKALVQRGNINFHVESEEYNFIEMTHHIILLSIVDIFAKKIY
jgi:hypothetical protein